MIDRSAVEQLFSTYGWPMDSREFDYLKEVFAQDASFSVSIAGTDALGPIEGRDQIHDLCAGIVSEQTDQRRHVITNHRIVSDDGDTARVTANLTLVVVDNGSIGVKSSGIYDCDVVEEDGVLRFKRMHLSLDVPF